MESYKFFSCSVIAYCQIITGQAIRNITLISQKRTKMKLSEFVQTFLKISEFVILNLEKKIGDSEFIKIIRENEFVKGN